MVPFNDSNLKGTINYAKITYQFWQTYKMFHRFSNEYGYEDVGPDGSNLANEHLVFLDGARANQFQLKEYGTDINTTTEQGVQTVFPGGEFIVTNDSQAESGSIGYVDAPAIYNYKPTALDEGYASEGLGRMVLSKLGNWGIDAGNPVAGAIYNYFAGDSASGTYFSFVNDESDNGEAHVYKVITTHPENDDIIIPVQKTIPQASRNFGWLKTSSQYGQGGDCPDTQPRSEPLHIWDALNYGGGIYNGVNFSGENFTCADEFGVQDEPCWKDLNDNMLGDTLDLEPIELRVGVFANDDGSNDYDTIGDPCNNRFNKICGQCNVSESLYDGYGAYGDSKVCTRESIRFEFRRVDKQTGLPTNIGVIPEDFDPRGWAKHDGTHGGIKIKILKPGVISGGEEVEVEEDRAVWETEPKEDADLDLYYEATHALPIKLKEGNTLAYAPLKSRVFVERIDPLTGNTIIDDLTINTENGQQYYNVMVGGAEYLEDGVIIKVVSSSVTMSELFGTDAVGLHSFGIGIGDTIVFEHSSGLQTRSVVEDYYVAPTSGENCTYTPQASFTTTLSFNFGLALLADTTDLVDGMLITGEGIPPGVFVSAVVGDGGTIPILTDTSWIEGTISGLAVTLTNPTGYYKIDKDVYKYKVKLGWHNCYSFGNGVESDRIRDDFNAPQIDNGVRVSTTLNEYGKEEKSSSLIFSGLYNTTSGVNDLNEFNMGEKIIKDLNPEYGTVQALKTRDTNVVVFCEDRILKVQANKEAVFMADNDPNIVATDRVLGTVSTFLGDYGISKNPESLAKDNYRLYCTDSQRGAVLRISMDGITPISNVGMKTWFRENITGVNGYGTRLLGTFDSVSGEYNLGVSNQTMVSFNEGGKGWSSFKSFIPDQGVSVSGKYLTVKKGTIYKHYTDTFGEDGEVNNRNLFYGATEITAGSQSTLTIMFNDVPGQVKSFKAMNYEGSQARVDQFTSQVVDNISYTDGEYYNLVPKNGWWVSNIQTDLQEGKITWFVDKENKWFNKICGLETSLENLDTSEFTVQGIGSPTVVDLPDADPPDTETDPPTPPQTFTLTIMNKTDNDPSDQNTNNDYA